MDAFLYSFNAVFPIFIMMEIGYLLKRFRVINETFTKTATRIVFLIAIPCMIFEDVYTSDISENFDPLLTGILVGATLLTVIGLRLIVPRLIPQPYDYAAFIQGAFRGNFLIIAVGVIGNIAGDQGIARMAVILCIFAIIYNILSVLILNEAQQESADKQPHKYRFLHTLSHNPLIIGTIAAILAVALKIPLPQMLLSAISSIGDMALPLSLIALGGTISFSTDKQNLRPALGAAIIKTLALPLIFVPLGAFVFGLRGVDLATLTVLMGAPTAISSFPMAHQMGANHRMASLIIVFSNCLALFTLFGFLYIERLTGLI